MLGTMRFWLLCICSARALAQAVVDDVHDVHIPVEILAVSRSGSDLAELTPLTFNAPQARIGLGDTARRDTVISGLLARQSCPSGYGACSGGDCCPLGGKCCGGGMFTSAFGAAPSLKVTRNLLPIGSLVLWGWLL